MAQTPASRPFIKEEFAPYTGPARPGFTPFLAGITWPNPSYEIRRERSECYVFEYVMEGKGYVRQGDVQFTLEKGDAYILHEGESHHYFSDKKDPWKKIWFNVSGSLVRHLISDYGLDTQVKIPSFGDDSYLTAIYDTIKRSHASQASSVSNNGCRSSRHPYVNNGQPAPRAVLMLNQKDQSPCTEELALYLHQYIQKLSLFVGQSKQCPDQALALKNYIEQNLMRSLSIDDMAEYVHLSRSRAIHLFKEVYGVTPYHYYLNQKGELACTLLKCTSLSIQEISERLGFSDYHHFSGFFRKWYGVSPSQYR